MANNYEQSTVTPKFPEAVCSPFVLQMLSDCGFEHEVWDGEVYFYSEEGTQEDPFWWDDEVRADLTHYPEPSDDFDREIMEAYSAGDSCPVDAYGVFQHLMPKANIEDVVIEGCYRSDKMRQGEFGGFITRVTPTEVQYGGTSTILAMMRNGQWPDD